MKTLNGCTTVHNGQLITCDIVDPFILGISLQIENITNNQNYNAIAYYYQEHSGKGLIKNCIVLYKNKKTLVAGAKVCKYGGPESTKMYWSRDYTSFIGMPRKYYDIVKYIHGEFVKLYGN